MNKKEFIIKYPNKNFQTRLDKKGVFIFDASSLLKIYSFTSTERKKFIKAIARLSKENRLWSPYQFFEEFERHRAQILQEELDAYTKFKNIFDQNLNIQLEDNKIKEFNNHSVLKVFIKKYLQEIKKYYASKLKDLSSLKKKHLLSDYDSIKVQLWNCYNNKIGDEYSFDRYQEICKEGEGRYKKFIPPGYTDVGKNQNDFTKQKQYGDLVAWYQIKDFAKKYKKPIIMITDDKKEDWWNINKKIRCGARIELVYELFCHAGVDLKMITFEDFLQYAEQKLNLKVTDTELTKYEERDQNILVTPLLEQSSVEKETSNNFN